MSNNDRGDDFSGDFGKTIPVKRKMWLRPVNHRREGLQTGKHFIESICMNKQEFCVDGGWYRMGDYKFGAIEPE